MRLYAPPHLHAHQASVLQVEIGAAVEGWRSAMRRAPATTPGKRANKRGSARKPRVRASASTPREFLGSATKRQQAEYLLRFSLDDALAMKKTLAQPRRRKHLGKPVFGSKTERNL